MTARRVIGVAGWKNSGKTTLVERLVKELTARGWRVATVKHAHHAFAIDREGTDSFRHRGAGAREVAIVSARRWALVHELGKDDEEPSLDEILAKLSPCDIVVVEGFKRGSHMKIEARRREAAEHTPLAAGDASFVAIATDHTVAEADVPVFHLDAIPALADFVEKVTGLK